MAGGPTSRHEGRNLRSGFGSFLVCTAYTDAELTEVLAGKRYTGIRGALDLSELDLDEVPPEIFDLVGLKVLPEPSVLQQTSSAPPSSSSILRACCRSSRLLVTASPSCHLQSAS